MTDMTEADRNAFEAWMQETSGFTEADEGIAQPAWQAALAHARGKQDGEAWEVSARESDGRTYLTVKRMDGVSASFSCQTNYASGETIASQVAKLFAEQYTAPPAESEEVARLRAKMQWAVETLTEINVNNHSYEDVCDLNAASVEVSLGLEDALAASPAPAPYEPIDTAPKDRPTLLTGCHFQMRRRMAATEATE